MREALTGSMRWMTSPAVDAGARAQDTGLLVLRVLLGLMWLYNVDWKRAPDFGEGAGNGLYRFTEYAVSYPVLAPYAWVVDHFVLPNIVPFGYGVIVAETALAVLLLTGAYVRAAAALGVAQSLAIALSVAFAPHEWPWSYWLMIGAHLVLLLAASARRGAVDAVRAGDASATPLARVWGTLALLVGSYSAVLSLGEPLAARGPGIRSTDLSVSLGQYNLLGGLLLALVGVLVLIGSRPGVSARLPLVAAVLATVGALSLHAQLGFSDPLLGGTPTSAAFLLCLAVVATLLTTTDSPKGRS